MSFKFGKNYILYEKSHINCCTAYLIITGNFNCEFIIITNTDKMRNSSISRMWPLQIFLILLCSQIINNLITGYVINNISVIRNNNNMIVRLIHPFYLSYFTDATFHIYIKYKLFKIFCLFLIIKTY